MRNYEDLPMRGQFPGGLDGDALVMAAEAGATVRTIPRILAIFMGYDVPASDGKPAAFRSAGTHELPLPHSMVVNDAGRRFGDEAFFQHLLNALRDFDVATHRLRNLPCYFVFSRGYVEKYGFGGAPAGQRAGLRSARRAHRGTGEHLGSIRPASRRRSRASTGSSMPARDADFGRGALAWSRSYAGDARNANPNLGRLEPPFYGVRLHPTGGMSAGLLTTVDAQVLGVRGEPIPGLYASGDCSAHVDMGVGQQAGISLGRMLIHGLAAAEHLRRAATRNEAGMIARGRFLQRRARRRRVPAIARAADPPSITVGIPPGYQGAIVDYAQQQGFFTAAGLDARIQVLNSGAIVATAVTGGSLELRRGQRRFAGIGAAARASAADRRAGDAHPVGAVRRRAARAEELADSQRRRPERKNDRDRRAQDGPARGVPRMARQARRRSEEREDVRDAAPRYGGGARCRPDRRGDHGRTVHHEGAAGESARSRSRSKTRSRSRCCFSRCAATRRGSRRTPRPPSSSPGRSAPRPSGARLTSKECRALLATSMKLEPAVANAMYLPLLTTTSSRARSHRSSTSC